MGVFRFSAALIKWSESELNDVKRLCVQAYKNAWHLPLLIASALFIFLKTHAGQESTLPMAVLTHELLLHAERCMRHEYVSKKIMLAGLNRTLDEWLCDSFVELIGEMELWKWDDATGDFLVETSKSTAAEQHLRNWVWEANEVQRYKTGGHSFHQCRSTSSKYCCISCRSFCDSPCTTRINT